ncbi:MAPK kinase substrate protein At1g80180 [Ricinus communis]|uniref:MAPK kinase substrate protein n=1 Tax=Ricinus communis TaxID=3988 RepID=B9SEP5_RICCO|nr:MAPK kinase substrate protein At1g80180 [Ricinus communis]EEF37904.1 conserved hypothetical protein [Ricinus communis]|eukprot:XP_002524464.1 MAPK kinase substrate protein At1g80180 [Ricinus communis]
MDSGGLQRSTTSFRRQGSSGLVWDDKFLTGESHQNNEKAETSSNGKLQRSQSAGGVIYRTVKVSSSPNVDPPSPKVSGCGLCGIFGKPVSASTNYNTTRHRQRRTK